MPLNRDYLEGMISPPVVVPSIADVPNVRVEQHAYREQQRVIGLTRAERTAIAAEQMEPFIADITTPAGEEAAKQTAANEAIHEGQKGNEEVGEVVVSPSVATIDVSDATTQQLTAAVYGVLGNPIERDVSWVSSDPTKATVSADGLVTPVAAGSSTITGSVGGESDTCVVTVTA